MPIVSTVGILLV